MALREGDSCISPGTAIPFFIVDVGAYAGTPWLYKKYSDEQFILIDPQDKKFILNPPKKFKYIKAFVSNFTGKSDVIGNGFKTRMGGNTGDIPVVKLVDVLPQGKFGLKVDTERNDLNVLLGLEERWVDVEWIWIEMFRNEYSNIEIMMLLSAKEFYLDKIRSDGADNYFDAKFTKLRLK